jgi:hypothetical protein
VAFKSYETELTVYEEQAALRQRALEWLQHAEQVVPGDEERRRLRAMQAMIHESIRKAAGWSLRRPCPSAAPLRCSAR